MTEGLHGPSKQPAMIVVVDTEEAFDWFAPFDRDATGIEHLRRLHGLQATCERWGVWPVYARPPGRLPGPRRRHATAAARVRSRPRRHPSPPWLSPPFEEDAIEFNSLPGSLPPSLERAKLAAQTGGIETSLGIRPLVYKAGRYGIGPNTVGILEELGHLVDLSPSPPFDYRSVYGPDFGRRGVKPAWYDSSANIQLAYGVAELTTQDLSGHGNNGALSSATRWTNTG